MTAWLSQSVYAAMVTPVAAPQSTPARAPGPCRVRGEYEMSSTPTTTSSTPTAPMTPGRSPSTATATTNVSSGPVPRAIG